MSAEELVHLDAGNDALEMARQLGRLEYVAERVVEIGAGLAGVDYLDDRLLEAIIAMKRVLDRFGT
jgi:hypothetical protein